MGKKYSLKKTIAVIVMLNFFFFFSFIVKINKCHNTFNHMVFFNRPGVAGAVLQTGS